MDIENTIASARHIHFIGIGGSGMFPIVQILHKFGVHITGSDNNEGSIIDQEREMGIEVSMGQRAENIPAGTDLVVYSAAISSENPELIAARESGVPTIGRADILGYITRQYDKCICVSGTHGKTSTTAMLTQVLMESGLDPTAVIGGKLPAIGGYGRVGSTQIMTCEACEYADTFLQLTPYISLILNIDEDHMEYFGSLENIIRSFLKFSESAAGCLIINGEDENCRTMLSKFKGRVITFGLGEQNDYSAGNIRQLSPTRIKFELIKHGEVLCEPEISVPGRHQVLNALAACAAAIEVGASPAAIAESLPRFRGAGRRFEILGNVNGVTIADDYAHHPAEIEVTLTAARTMGYRKVWAVFQPFTFSRTARLLDDFARTLSIADHVVMSAIMGGREENTYDIHTNDLAAKIPGSMWFEGFDQIAQYVLENAQPGDLVLTMGCGDVYKCANMMVGKN